MNVMGKSFIQTTNTMPNTNPDITIPCKTISLRITPEVADKLPAAEPVILVEEPVAVLAVGVDVVGTGMVATATVGVGEDEI